MIPAIVLDKATPVHILVVDDEPEIAESLSEFLTRTENYRITIARNGREAMEVLEAAALDPSQAIDLVLLDVRMPIMSGPEVLAWLRDHPNLKFTRVIMLTAAAGNEEKVEALSAGADDYITKPYYPLELLARVKTILRTQQLEKQLQYQTQQLITLNRISQSITAKLSTNDVLSMAVEAADAVVGFETTAVFLTDDQQTFLHCQSVHSDNFYTNTSSFGRIPIGRGIIGKAYRLGKTLYVNGPPADNNGDLGFIAPDGMVILSILTSPLFIRGKPLGVLVGINKRHGSIATIDQSLFASVATSVSRALEIAWLFQHLQKRQQQLLENRNMLQAVIDGILHSIYTVNEKWRLVAINKAKSDELGKSSEEVAGQTCYNAFFGRTMPCEHCLLASTLTERDARRWAVSQPSNGQRSREWDVNAFPIPGSQINAARAVVVWQDRTEEKRLENSLMQAAKLAAIGQLAAGVAHEINNPLTAINANAQMLQLTLPPNDDNVEAVDLIVKAGDRAAKVVRGLLDYARQTQYEFKRIDVNESIVHALELVSYQLATANIRVRTNLSESMPEVEASREHLQSVWLNLLINARDALQEMPGDRLIEISSGSTPSADNVWVKVQDNGRGIPAEDLDHIFEPFFTTKDPGRGTGLGLATCQQIIQQHGGLIDVSSEPGKGTSFEVRLMIRRRLPDR